VTAMNLKTKKLIQIIFELIVLGTVLYYLGMKLYDAYVKIK
jgi:hypothetical protein